MKKPRPCGAGSRGALICLLRQLQRGHGPGMHPSASILVRNSPTPAQAVREPRARATSAAAVHRRTLELALVATGTARADERVGQLVAQRRAGAGLLEPDNELSAPGSSRTRAAPTSAGPQAGSTVRSTATAAATTSRSTRLTGVRVTSHLLRPFIRRTIRGRCHE